MEAELIILILLAGSALCAAVGGCVAYLKRRSPWRGCVMGALLGPLGVALMLRLPFAHRPMVDQPAWSSFRSMVEHQSSNEIVCLAGRPEPCRADAAPAERLAWRRPQSA